MWGNIEIINFTQQKEEEERNYLVSEPNYHTAKSFTENLLPIKTRKIQILINKPVYLGLSKLELSNE